jgi:hypothetical protein
MPGHAWLRRLTLAATLAGLHFLNPSMVQGQPRVTWVSGGSVGASLQVLPDQYIVVLTDDVVSIPTVAREMAEQYGLGISQVYEHALRGFAARIPRETLRAVCTDNRVLSVSAERTYQAFGASADPTSSGSTGGSNLDSSDPCSSARRD